MTTTSFWQVCASGNLAKVKQHKNPDKPSQAFAWACANGHLEVAKHLIGTFPGIDPHIDNEWPFRMACAGGYLELAKMLVATFPETNVYAEDNWAYRIASENGKKPVTEWLISTFPLLKNIVNISAWINSQEPLISDVLRRLTIDTKVAKLFVNVPEARYMETIHEVLSPNSKRRIKEEEKKKKKNA